MKRPLVHGDDDSRKLIKSKTTFTLYHHGQRPVVLVIILLIAAVVDVVCTFFLWDGHAVSGFLVTLLLGVIAPLPFVFYYGIHSRLLVFDDFTKSILLDDLRCLGCIHTSTTLGPYEAFKGCQLRKQKRDKNTTMTARYIIHFRFANRAQAESSQSNWAMDGNPSRSKQVISEINEWWNQKKKGVAGAPRVVKERKEGIEPRISPKMQLAVRSGASISISEGNIVGNDGNEYTERMRSWMVSTVKLPEYTESLIENGFDRMEMFENLSMEDLNLMGITKIGHRKRILAEAQKLNGSLAPSQPSQEVDEVDNAVIIDIPVMEANILGDEQPGSGATEPPPAFQEAQ